ncbi:hypothetical protein QYF36_025905 [Acer negundo]|nr:hypothetical protein QYF36_025905 [Acer negundo]
MFKNRLQYYTQRSNIDLPFYSVINEGSQHSPLFWVTVLVDRETYTSSNTCSHQKFVEQDVAKFALECILTKTKIEGSLLITKDKLKDKLFDASLHKEEDFIYGTESLRAGNLVGRMVENHNVQSANVTITVQVVNVQTSETLGTSLGLLLLHHPFKRPEPEPSSETVNLPISFVPPVLRQLSGVSTSTSKKQRKNKDKANKRFLADAK